MSFTDFASAGKAVTQTSGSLPISFYPPWYARFYYWLNSAEFREDNPSEWRIRQAYDFPILERSDYRTLMSVAKRHSLIDSDIDVPSSKQLSETLYAAKDRDAERQAREKFKEEIIAWLKRIDRLLVELEPHVRNPENTFSKNLSIICEINELSSLEREILALYHSDAVARYIQKQTRDDDEEDYGKFVAKMLGISTDRVDEKHLSGSINKLIAAPMREIGSGEEICAAMFRSGQLFDAYLLVNVDEDGSGPSHGYLIDDNTLELLEMPNLTKELALANSIGTPLESELDYEQDFDYLPFHEELLDGTLGALHRDTKLGKVSCLVGKPGAGKSKLPKVLAKQIEIIIRKTDPDFHLPVYVIGTEKDAKVRKSRRVKDTFQYADKKEKETTASRRDVIKALRARRTLQRLGITAFLVIEEADGILSSEASAKGDNITRAHAHQILDESPVVTWLISNHPEKFDEAVRRRIKTYDMGAPPADKRRKMIVGIADKLGLEVTVEDARIISQQYVFTPGIIESALLHILDVVRGREIRLGEKIKKIGLDDLSKGFNRKAVTLAGTNVKLVQKLAIPESIDPELYITNDLELYEFEDLVSGKAKPRLWMMAGDSSTEVRELALYAAGNYGDPQVIQIGAYGTNLLEQLEAAKREKVPVVITGFEDYLKEIDIVEMRRHPLLIAAHDHATSGYPVFIVAEMMPSQIAEKCKAIFNEVGRSFIGFELATGLDLYRMIKKISGIELPSAANNFLTYPIEHPAHKEDIDRSPFTTHRGMIVAGPKDVRNAVYAIKIDGGDLSLGKLAEVMQRQGVICTHNRKEIQMLTGLHPKPLAPNYH